MVPLGYPGPQGSSRNPGVVPEFLIRMISYRNCGVYLVDDMTKLVDHFRANFQGASAGTLFIDGGLLPYWVDKENGTADVMEAIYSLNTSRPCTGTADSRIFSDFISGTDTPNGDPRARSGIDGSVIHFNATQAVQMGYEYFDAYKRAVALNTVVPSAKTQACNGTSAPSVAQCSGSTVLVCDFLQSVGLDNYAERAAVSSRDACCAMCAARDGCSRAVYQNGKCKFGTSTAAQVEVSDAVMCMPKSPSPAPTPTPTPIPGPTPSPSTCTCQQGMGLDGYIAREDASSQEECCDICGKQDGCTQAVFQHGKCKISNSAAAQIAVSDAVLCRVQARQMEQTVV